VAWHGITRYELFQAIGVAQGRAPAPALRRRATIASLSRSMAGVRRKASEAPSPEHQASAKQAICAV
jgi:hypothetical protein